MCRRALHINGLFKLLFLQLRTPNWIRTNVSSGVCPNPLDDRSKFGCYRLPNEPYQEYVTTVMSIYYAS